MIDSERRQIQIAFEFFLARLKNFAVRGSWRDVLANTVPSPGARVAHVHGSENFLVAYHPAGRQMCVDEHPHPYPYRRLPRIDPPPRASRASRCWFSAGRVAVTVRPRPFSTAC